MGGEEVSYLEDFGHGFVAQLLILGEHEDLGGGWVGGLAGLMGG